MLLLFFQSIFYFPDCFPPFLSIASAVPCVCASWWSLRLWMLGATAVCQRPAALIQGCFCLSALWLTGWQTLCQYFSLGSCGLFCSFPFLTKVPFLLSDCYSQGTFNSHTAVLPSRALGLCSALSFSLNPILWLLPGADFYILSVVAV